MINREYQICTRCVMDTSDPDIHFDEQGVCNHCHTRYELINKLPKGKDAELILEQKVDTIRKDGKGKEYDCIIGVSGGVDSSYVAYLVKNLGLRALAVHLDNGWNSELAVKNIENMLNKLGIELYTYVIDWEEFRDLQLAFLKASTPDSEIPSDHAIAACVVKTSWERDIKHLVWGMNTQTETHLPRAWSYGHQDWLYIKSLHDQFGKIPLKTFPHLDFWDAHKFRIQFGKYSHVILDCVEYSKTEAMTKLQDELDWKYYGGKHYESIYTRFYQGYILPKKFGFDKRKSHLSSLICGGEITREAALEEIEKETYSLKLQMEDRDYVIKKLGLTETEFEEIMQLPLKSFWDYPSYERKYFNSIPYNFARKIYKLFRG